ncbi:MAG: UPF0147 family protein [Candidatus Diapherotrites archaeon]|nr:UPF0147 family protein [Candidatus Diapherotrites archaeon]
MAVKKSLSPELKKEVEDCLGLMEEILSDRSVPRNIRAVIEDAKAKASAFEDGGVNFSGAIYLLDDISNDINMPSHTRTEIWTLISLLEAVKEKVK